MVEHHPPIALHPDIAPLAPLLGTWRGSGQGDYSTVEPFGYVEEIRFGHLGRPFLTYRQKTRATADRRPLHSETGYLRCPRPDRVELILAHPTGITEICEGPLTLDNGRLCLELDSTDIGCSTTAKLVTALGRSIRMSGDTIDYTLRMAAVGEPLQQHLTATLHKV
ncbi:peroxynitrite isomerase [Nocardia sp. NPDC049190]|uniref:peroxynitrite isomerase n=1 Tax=Nocardia sp. NPDC049190 TaxID=3155650 RepID=UPI0033D041F3